MAVTERRTQIYLSDEQHRAATELARERGSSLAAVIREALDRYLTTADQRPSAPWADDPARSLLGSLELTPLSDDGGADSDLVEAIDRSVYDGG